MSDSYPGFESPPHSDGARAVGTRSLLSPGDPEPYEIVNGGAGAPVVVVCDHASCELPRRLGTLGVAPAVLKRHIAWDIGAARVARELARLLDARGVLAGYSRLVVDCNRALDDPSAFVAFGDGDFVPGNHDLDDEQKARRAREIYWPYHQAVETELDRFRLRGVTPALIAVHSFTPFFNQAKRPWEIGVLWDVDPRIPIRFMAALGTQDVIFGDNQPYSGRHPADFTIDYHAEAAGLPCVSIEVRQDLIGGPAEAGSWAKIIARALGPALADESLYRPWRWEERQ